MVLFCMNEKNAFTDKIIFETRPERKMRDIFMWFYTATVFCSVNLIALMKIAWHSHIVLDQSSMVLIFIEEKH